MASYSHVGDNQLQRIIRDLQEAVLELSKEHRECGEPITDDCPNLRKFFYKFEYLLQFDQKEKSTFLGQRKDYWDYFSECLIKIKGANDGIRFVKSIPELKTSLGKGRAFIRYCLVHQRLADTLQQCLINQKVTSDWYYARSPFLRSHLTSDIINHLYELNQIQFDVAARGYDLDADWPSFARRTLGSACAYSWRPPSRCSSVNSLVSSLSQLLAVQQSSLEYTENHLLNVQEKCELRDRLCAAENRNMELITKLDEALKEKGQQTASYCNSARKMQELLDKLKITEQERIEAKREEKLAQVKAKAESERELALQRLEELQGAVGRIQGALTLKEKEAGNLRAQLQGLQASLESRERQAEELRRRLQEEQEEVEQRVVDLKITLQTREKELSASSERIKHLEEQLEKLNVDVGSHSAAEMPSSGDGIGDYKAQCSTLTEINAKLLLTVKKSEDSIKELSECKAVMLEQLSVLRASEKHLSGRLDMANVSVEDREKKLLVENLHLEESAQKLQTQKDELQVQLKGIEQEKMDVSEARSLLEKELAVIRDERDLLVARETMLERNVSASQKGNDSLLEKLQETEDKLKDQTVQGGILQARVVELEGRVAELHSEKGAAESNEKTQKAETNEAPFKLVIAETQLEMNLTEMRRLQEQVVSLRGQLQACTEEKVKAQALQRVTEASRQDLRVLEEQLKGQVEALNRTHVDDILRSREREEALTRERDGEAQARVGLAAEVTASRDELDRLRRSYDALCVEHGDTREVLRRANTEMAEMGVHVCMLTADNEEARLRLEGLCSRLEEMDEEMDALNATIEQLQEEKQQLLNQISAADGAVSVTKHEMEHKLSQSHGETEALRATSEEEVQALRFQISNQETNHSKQIQVQTRVQGDGGKTTKARAAAEHACQELSENLRRVTQDKKSVDLKTAAELDDLYRTKINLEERLIELIREKDALWQKTDALEFEQKLRDEETERDVNHCLSCLSPFSFWLRKYTCRLCGRPFCYYCCSNTVTTQQGGTKERCCLDCYNQHSAVIERHPQEEPLNYSSTPVTPLHRAPQTPPSIKTNKNKLIIHMTYPALFCFICPRSSSASAGDLTSEDPEDLSTTVQDAEIGLLKSGELTLCVPFSLDDICAFGDSYRELFIKSSCYSSLPLSMSSAGPTVSWTFTSDPKSISFSVVYRESPDTPPEQAKVLIPLTRCNSHKETIQGEMKVRHPGEYTLIFDNSFSRFISKKVLYHLSVDKPVVYDGSDLL
uniref:FYVE and coiled-coil domain containing 1b n=1 Tax=Neogobius melanostomus TaxID=47308 RepID=A0A8C6UNL0_9GOBI